VPNSDVTAIRGISIFLEILFLNKVLIHQRSRGLLNPAHGIITAIEKASKITATSVFLMPYLFFVNKKNCLE
jgi:hypothetical protein